MRTQTPSTEPKDYWRNAEILKSMQKLPLTYDNGGEEGKFGKNRINVEFTLENKFLVRREVDYSWIEDAHGLVVCAQVLGYPFPFQPLNVEMEIQHHIEELHLAAVRNLTIE